MRRSAIFAIICGVLGVLLYEASTRTSTRNTGDTQVPPHAPPTEGLTRAVWPASMAAERVFRVGDRFAYSVNVESSVTIESAEAAGATQELASKLLGTWSVTVLEVTREKIVCAGTIEPRTLSFNGAAVDPSTTTLSRPHRFTLSRDGRVLGIGIAPDDDALTGSYFRTMLAQTQLTASPPSQHTWFAEESDTMGTYAAKYTRRDEEIVRTKDSYLRTSSSRSAEISVAGKTSYELDASNGWPASITVHEVVINDGRTQKMPKISGNTRMQVQLAGVSRGGLPPHLADVRDQTLDDQALTPSMQAALDQNRLRGANLADLLERLATAASLDEEGAGAARRSEIPRFAALFRVQSSAISEAGDAVRRGMDTLAAGIVFEGLAESARPDATRELASFIRDPSLDSEQRTRAALALAFTTAPTAEGVDALAEASRSENAELNNAATLALGIQAKLGGHGAIVTDPVASLMDRLSGATDVQEITTILESLGNTEDERAVPVLMQYAGNEEPLIRTSAIHALRSMDDSSAEATIRAAITSDTEAMVRQVAVSVAWQKPSEPMFDAVEYALRNDAVSRVQLEAVRTVAAMSDNPRALPLLREIAEHGASEDLRELAASFF